MFMLLSLILSFVSVSLKFSASGLELASKVAGRLSKDNSVYGVAKHGIATSVLSIRFIAFIVARIRDVISIMGSFIIIMQVVLLMVIFVVSANLPLFTSIDEGGILSLNGVSYNRVIHGTNNSVAQESVSSKPLGVSEESWSKADSIGKSIVSFAVDSIINPPNGEYLLYKQGNTPVGYADCSVFVCAVFEGALNRTFGGGYAPDGYDFAKNKKSDLKAYVTTYGMEAIVHSIPLSKIGSTREGFDKAMPGDVLLTDGHVGIYVGKNEDGVDVMVHAASSDGTCHGDIMLSDGKNLQVGFSKVWGTYDIIRPSILLGY